MNEPGPIKVMLVDDSAVVRGFLTRFLESENDIRVTSSVSNGQMALDSMERNRFDVIVLDIEMPVMNGMEALPLILKKDHDVQVIIASTLTVENAGITLRALESGAAECLAKPSSNQDLSGTSEFRQSLVLKTRELGIVARKRRGEALPSSAAPAAQPAQKKDAPEKGLSLRSEPIGFIPDAVAIGASTGGPQALLEIFSHLKDGFRQPVFLTQHMPPTFTGILAEHIAKASGLRVAEAVEGEIVTPGRVYVAPGNFHMGVRADGAKRLITLNQDPPENFCRPAVDPMLRSLVAAYGPRVLTMILTGMGHDGLKGCESVVNAGGVVMAQDEKTSIVWGMPGAVSKAGLCTQVIALPDIAKTIRKYAGAP